MGKEPKYRTAKEIPLNELQHYKFLCAGECCTFEGIGRGAEVGKVIFRDADGKRQSATNNQLPSILLLPLTQEGQSYTRLDGKVV